MGFSILKSRSTHLLACFVATVMVLAVSFAQPVGGDTTGSPNFNTTPGKVTGGGSIGGPETNFSFIVEFREGDSSPRGQLTYVDGAGGLRLKSTDIRGIAILKPRAIWEGTIDKLTPSAPFYCDLPLPFRIDVQDNGEPGKGLDTFAIQIGDCYSRSGVLTGGNIQVH